jgi:hypothetical protein
MGLLEFDILPHEELFHIRQFQNTTGVEWIKKNTRVSGDEMSWEIDALDAHASA